VERADEALRGNKDKIEGKIEESANEINDSTFIITKKKICKGTTKCGQSGKGNKES
jgi:hypothetical protein